MQKVLVIEDEVAYSELVKGLLTKAGYKVVTAPSAEEGLQKIKRGMPDMVIIDIGLPGMSGMSLCDVVKKDPATSTMPIIMLTSKKEESSKVQGLVTGADDYITKPFSSKELLARIEALFRRVQRQGGSQALLQAGKIVVNVDAHEVKVAGKPVELRPKEFELLVLFLKKKGRVLLYDHIAESVWGDERIATRQDVKWWVHHLREKLGAAGDAIETVTNQGYKLAE